MIRPKFSIIVTAYKRYNPIRCMLYSLASQTFTDFEVFVIHDGHDDKHSQLMHEFTDPRIHYRQTFERYDDWGMSLRNLEIPRATGDFVINTNDDNYYTPNWLQELATAIDSDPECNFVYYDMVLNHNNIENHNQKDYGLFVPQLRHSYIDMGQFTIKRELIQDYRFSSNAPADGEFIESVKDKLKPIYINKILFVHN